MQVDLADRGVLVQQSVFGVLAPVVGGADDHPVGERLFARRGEKAVDVLFLKLVGGVVELALDGVELAGAGGLRHQVDAGVARVQALGFRPLGIGPHLTVKVAVTGRVAQVADHQLLEIGALFALGDGGVAIRVEKLSESSHCAFS